MASLLRGQVRWGRALALFLALWTCCLFYFLSTLNKGASASSCQEEAQGLRDALRRAKDEAERLGRENSGLRALLKEAQQQHKEVRRRARRPHCNHERR